MADEYKSLTVVHLPFAGKNAEGRTFEAGATIARADFEQNAEHELGQDADDEIGALVSAGAISEDMDAPLHPSAVIPAPNEPTMGSVKSAAQFVVERLESSGQEVPEELKAMANLDVADVTTNDAGASGEGTA